MRFKFKAIQIIGQWRAEHTADKSPVVQRKKMLTQTQTSTDSDSQLKNILK